MNLPPDDLAFLAGLVKMSRQRTHYVHWVDRDGSNRNSALTTPEITRVNSLAAQLGTNKGELLRQAAHIPVPKFTGPKKAEGSSETIE